ncbi:MAG: hypothetical protein L0099_16940, partial [Acidobacteria bacterium]|nr:hypothetical protein [Acidobacteriota bacterium]
MTQRVLALLLLLIADTLSFAQTPLPEPLALTFRVYNYARVGEQELAQAQAEAARLLAEVGVAAEWRDCPLTEGASAANHACESAPGAGDVLLRILPQEMAERFRLPPKTCGYAIQSEDEQSLLYGNVFYHCVEEMKKVNPQYRRAWVLALLLTHEAGHLLLGTNAHTRGGIMRANWKARDLEAGAQGDIH